MSIDVHSELAAVLRRHDLLGADLLVALSGGLDSVCLLRLLVAAVAPCGGRVEVAHVDHALRPDSADDAAFCRSLAGELGCPFHLRRLGSGAWRDGEGRQAAARRARRRYFEEVAGRRGLAAVALGHHADDQAETVLYRIARGTGLRGAGGMAEYTPPYLRPLLHLDRTRLQALAAARGWAYREDPSNRSDRYARNRLRHQALPLLEQVHPGASAGVLRFARLAAEDDRVLTRLAREALAGLAVAEPDGVRLPVAGLASLEVPLRRRVYLALWSGAGWPVAALNSRHLDAVDGLLQPGRAHRFAPIPGPGRFAVSYDQLWLLPPRPPPAAPWEATLAGFGSGSATLPAGRLRWDPARPAGGGAVGLPAGAGAAVWVRSRRPGDRVARPGHRSRKLKELLIAARVPLWRRPGVLVVGAGERAFAALGAGFAWGGAEPAGTWLWLETGPGGEEDTGPGGARRGPPGGKGPGPKQER